MGYCSKEVSCRSHFDSRNMVLPVQDIKLLYYQEIQGMLLCEIGCTEDHFQCTLELLLYSVTVLNIEVDIDFAVYYMFA